MPEPNERLTLTSPFPHIDDKPVEWVHSKLPSEIFNYFFRHVLVGKDGKRQILIQTFFKKLYDECVAAGIEPVWDINNEHRVAEILSRLNFTTNVELRPERPARPRRTNPRPPVNKAQPKGEGHDGRPASGDGQQTPHDGK